MLRGAVQSEGYRCFDVVIEGRFGKTPSTYGILHRPAKQRVPALEGDTTYAAVSIDFNLKGDATFDVRYSIKRGIFRQDDGSRLERCTVLQAHAGYSGRNLGGLVQIRGLIWSVLEQCIVLA